MERIIGAIPPPGTDMSLQPLVGCRARHHTVAWSIAGTDEFCLLRQSRQGVHMTDGASVADLTEQGGIKSYWQDVVATAGHGSFAGGFFRGYYFVDPGRGGRAATSAILPSRRWFVFVEHQRPLLRPQDRRQARSCTSA